MLNLTKEQKQYAQRVMNQGRGCYIMEGEDVYEVRRIRGRLVGVKVVNFQVERATDSSGVTLTTGNVIKNREVNT